MLNYFIFTTNAKTYNLDQSINKNNFVYWHKRIIKIKTGDIVFIYSAIPNKRILYKATVSEVVPNYDYVFDREFYNKQGPNPNYKGKEFVKLTNFMKCNDVNLSYDKLKSFGLKGIEGQQEINNKPELLKYIKSSISKQELFEALEYDKNLNSTEKEILSKYRIGQGKYRDELFELYKGSCVISKVKVEEILIASHILPWSESNNYQKTDKYNGLLLAASIDKLFDQKLISFDDNGFMVISQFFKDNYSNYEKIMLNIGIYKSYINRTKSLDLHPKTKEYMKIHFQSLK